MGNSNQKLLAALLTGAAIGGALGILFAPDKGSETRKKISKKSGDVTDAVKEKFSNIVNKFKKTEDDVEDMVSNGKSVVEKLAKS